MIKACKDSSNEICWASKNSKIGNKFSFAPINIFLDSDFEMLYLCFFCLYLCNICERKSFFPCFREVSPDGVFAGCSVGVFGVCSVEVFAGCSVGVFGVCSVGVFPGCSVGVFWEFAGCYVGVSEEFPLIVLEG